MSVAIPIRTNKAGTRYFTPRFVNIVVGETITWYNAGKDIHSLIFDTEIPPYDIKIGDVVPVGTLSRRFDFYVPRIDYSCATHPEEKGTIVIYEKNEGDGEITPFTMILRHKTPRCPRLSGTRANSVWKDSVTGYSQICFTRKISGSVDL